MRTQKEELRAWLGNWLVLKKCQLINEVPLILAGLDWGHCKMEEKKYQFHRSQSNAPQALSEFT